MRRLGWLGMVLLIMTGCGISKQSKQIKALEKCTYKLRSADAVTVAGTDAKKLIDGASFDLSALPGLAFALLRQDVPLKARLNLEVTNPSGEPASINQFEYKILINNQDLANGVVSQEINVAPGESTVVPVDMEVNIFPFVSNSKVMGQVAEFVKGGKNGEEKKGLLTLKIRPSIKVAGALIKYPGFITIDKEISNKFLF